MRARSGLWELWVGNDPGPPGPEGVTLRSRLHSVGRTAARGDFDFVTSGNETEVYNT